MDFDFDDLEDQSRGEDVEKLRSFVDKLLQILAIKEQELNQLRETCENRRQFEKERDKLIGPEYEKLFKEHDVYWWWHIYETEQLKKESEIIAEQSKRYDDAYTFGTLGPLELEKGDCVEVLSKQTKGVLWNFKQGMYGVKRMGQVTTCDPKDLRKLGKTDIVKSILAEALPKLDTPDVKAELDDVREQSDSPGDFNRKVADRLSELMGDIVKSHGVTVPWCFQAARSLKDDQEVGPLYQKVSAIAEYGILGPAQLFKHQLVELFGLTEMVQMNGQRGVVRAWLEDKGRYSVFLAADRMVNIAPQNLKKVELEESKKAMYTYITQMIASQKVQGAIEHIKERCTTQDQYWAAVPHIMRQVSGAVWERFGEEVQWEELLLDNDTADDETKAVASHIFEAVYIGKASRDVEKGAFIQVSGIKEEEEGYELNDRAVVVNEWSKDGRCWVYPLKGKLNEPTEIRLKRTKPLLVKNFKGVEEAREMQKDLMKMMSESGKRRLLNLGEGRDDPEALDAALLDIQKPVLQKYGFRQDTIGLQMAQRALTICAIVDPAVAEGNGRLERIRGRKEISYKDRVAVVLNAGSNLGRATSLLFAKRGAKVLVHDSTPGAAEMIVDAITAAGGTAEASSISLYKNGPAVIEAALNTFDHVDTVVCCTKEDKDECLFSEMDADNFIDQYNEFVVGNWRTCKKVWAPLLEQGHGKIVWVSGPAGLHGKYGKLTTAAIQGAHLTLSQTAALEAYRYGVLSNCICVDSSDESGAVPIAYLGHPSCPNSGGIFECSSGHVRSFRWLTDEDFADFRMDQGDAALETAAAKWSAVARWEKTETPGMRIHGSYRKDAMSVVHMKRATAILEKSPLSLQSPPPQAPPELRYDGRVAIVTGGGRGIGRAYCHLLARRGAKVVVNNRTPAKADEVVAEIKAFGGIAVPDYNDVASKGDKIAEVAIKQFGKVDIIICNAGQLEDSRMENMKIEQFEAVVGTHIYGHVRLLKVVWPLLVKQGYGRIVFISSTSGYHGNPGQSNYGSCKMAMVAMAETLAMEGASSGVNVHAIATEGFTRMTNGLLPKNQQVTQEALWDVPQPARIPSVVLCHESTKATAGIYSSVDGHTQALRWQADDAFVDFNPNSGHEALEHVAAQWPSFGWWEKVKYPGHELHEKYFTAWPAGIDM